MNVSEFQNTITQVLSTSHAVRGGAVTIPSIEAPPRKSDILAESFIKVERKVPTLETGSAVAGFRVNADAEFLDAKFRNPTPPAEAVLDKNPNLAATKLDVLGEIKISLANLDDVVKISRSSDTLNTRLASSFRPELVDAFANQSSPVGRFSVLPRKTSTDNVLVSDEQTTPLAPLGKSGSFVVNGVKLTVVSTDTIVDLRNKINFGEDANRNGSIDGAEDRNGNGVADVININPSKSGPGVYIVEDANGNGTLDTAEDVNDNKKLDGGTQENKVVASIQRNRLVLTSAVGGASSIDLQDTDNILLSIGFFERNSKGLPIQKEAQIDFSKNPPEELIKIQDRALIRVGNTTFASDTNVFPGTVTGTLLKIKRASDLSTQVDIVNDSDKATQQIKTIVDKFNASIRSLNSVLARPGLFDKDFKVQNIRNDLVNAAEPIIRETDKTNKNIDRINANRQNQNVTGLEVVNPEKKVVQETALTSVVSGIKNGLTLPFKNGGNDLQQRLSTVGIKTESDDTIRVDEAELKKALTVNTDGVRDIFNNPDTGLLPQLDRVLGGILKNGVGDLDIKRDEVLIHSNIPSALVEKFQRFVENATLRNKIQNLIAVA